MVEKEIHTIKEIETDLPRIFFEKHEGTFSEPIRTLIVVSDKTSEKTFGTFKKVKEEK